MVGHATTKAGPTLFALRLSSLLSL
jgi:hypothetical protein